MSSKHSRDIPSPSPSASSFLPSIPRRSRRSSLASVSSLSKGALSQALDHIHNSASQSETLTTFNEFSSPPPAVTNAEGKSLTGDLVHGGISGLYNRFRASVSGGKEPAGVYSATPEQKSTKASLARDSILPSNTQPSQRSSSLSRDLSPGHRNSEEGLPTISQTPSPSISTLDAEHEHRAVASNALPQRITETAQGNNRIHFDIPPSMVVDKTTRTTSNPSVPESSLNVKGITIESRNSDPGPAGFGNAFVGDVRRIKDVPVAQDHESLRPRKGSVKKDDTFPMDFGNAHVGQPGNSGGRTQTLVRGPDGAVRNGSGSGLSGQSRATTDRNLEAEPLSIPLSTKDQESLSKQPQNPSSLFSEHSTIRDSPEQSFVANDPSSHRRSVSNAVHTSARTETPQPERKPSAASEISRTHERPALATRVSQSRLPGYRMSRTSSSDAEESLPATPAADERQVQLGDDYAASNQTRLKHPSSKGNQLDSDTFNPILPQPRSKVLSKEYWMRDENAKDCFCCGDTFSTFRRKHHCRTCGQIFDSKCTSLVSGRRFDQPGSIRVCKPCELIINGYDDSSDLSDDGTISSGSPFRQRQVVNAPSDKILENSTQPDHFTSRKPVQDQNQNLTGTPVMAIPATRRARDASSRGSAVLEIDGPRSSTLSRPSSSRSLKASMTGRPHSSSHKRHHSRYQHLRGFKPLAEDRAPFHRSIADEKTSALPAFHNDSIIDPDLAPYLSDDGSSPDEQISIFGALNSDMPVSSMGAEKNGLGGFLAAVKKGRSRLGEKSLSVSLGRDPDEISLGSSRANGMIRSSRKRNLSAANLVHQRVSPTNKQAITNRGWGNGDGNVTGSPVAEDSVKNALRISTLTRSASMTGIDAPAVELNNASLQHVSKLLKQLLQDSAVPNVSRWEKALLPILLQSTDDVNPDVSHGDDIDIRHFVKLKKVPGGRPGDTHYVSGVVFTKNLALKSMPRSIFNPRIVIVTFPLEYARHQQHFMSLEPVISQEREFLENLVNRIAALQPQLLLVQRNVSGLALQFLEEANIATAYNVKPSVIEAVSRCTQARIISSIDKLAIKPAQLGTCEGFHLKTYVQGNRKKTYMYFSGCPKDLGCTIVLRGAEVDILSKIKKITEFMIYVVYNLKLETCLMRDEFVLIPSSTSEGSLTPGNNACSQLSTNGQRSSSAKREDAKIESDSNFVNPSDSSGSALHGATLGSNSEQQDESQATSSKNELANVSTPDELSMPDDVPMPTFYEDMIEKHKNTILSASPFVKFMQPYLLMRAREQERRLAYLKRLRDHDNGEETVVDEKERSQKFDLIKPEMIHESVQGASTKVREVLRAVHDAEYDKALHSYKTQKRQWETYISGNRDLFDPFSHQSIVVLYSVVCTVTTVPCFGPELLALEFYNEHGNDFDFEADCTLGQYVEELCLGSDTICMANGCERKMFDHHRQYVHGEAQVSVFVQQYPSKLRGMQDTILMWNCCRVCGTETQVIPMSESTWKYSFGKYLELSFWSSDLHPRAGVCAHDIHRDHLRYFGYKDVALRIQYDPINLLEIIVPRPRVIWKVENDLRIKNEQFEKTEERISRFMSSVKGRIKGIKLESVPPEKSEACKTEIERLAKKANDDHSYLMRNLQDKYMDSKYYEMIPLNRAVRAMQEKVAEWDTAFADFDRNFFPSERDIRRLATLQLKKIFLDRDDASVGTVETGPESSSTEIEMSEKPAHDKSIAIEPQPAHMSPEETHDVLASVVEEQAKTIEQSDVQQAAVTEKASPGSGSPGNTGTLPVDLQELSGNGVHHFDLAVPLEVSERASSANKSASEGKQKDRSGSAFSDSTAEASSTQPPSALEPRITEKVEQMRKSALNAGASSSQIPVSAIPRLAQIPSRARNGSTSPPLYRTQSQPAHLHLEPNRNGVRNSSPSSASPVFKGMPSPSNSGDSSRHVSAESSKGDKKLPERLGVNMVKPIKHASGHSLIPRSIQHARKDSKVFTLAKHFEQLSREFEKERLRERRLRAARNRQSRAHPITSSKPIVEVYRNVHEAVEEREPSDDDHSTHESRRDSQDTINAIDNGLSQSPPPSTISHSPEESTMATEIASEHGPEQIEPIPEASQAPSEADAEHEASDVERSILDDMPEPTDESQIASPTESSLELPKHEKTSLMKMLTNFWAERSASGWTALDYPLISTDHVFADSDIIVREDEPSSLIAFALGSEDYMTKLRAIRERKDDSGAPEDQSRPASTTSIEDNDQIEVERSLLRSTGTHLKYQFQEGSAKMLCKIFYAEQFDALRRKCGVSDRIVESFSRCLKWDSKGGKTKSVFLKTLDDRFVLKSLSPIETQAFLKFAPAYFQIMSEALFHELPSVIAKMFGFYQVIIKNPNTGVEFNWYLLAMENLFYDRTPTRIFDLKGSMRNRYTRSTGEQNEVLLDENMVEFIYESPLFAREHSKRLLRASVWNDTLFLARQNVMDYSLMIAIDENRKELVVGIIDCIRTYTWDKKLESWIKDRGKNKPTVTSPKEYKSRFREAMGRYVLQAPNCWHQFTPQTIERRVPPRLNGVPADGSTLDNERLDARPVV